MNGDKFLQDRAILSPSLEVVEQINDYMLSLIPGEEKIYNSADSICNTSGNSDWPDYLYTPEFLNSIKGSGLPNHSLKLKVGVTVMLLMNMDPANGFCNGTRLIITKMGCFVLEARIISEGNNGNRVYIPRIPLTSSDSSMSFQLQRRQLPLVVSYAMTINKSWGQSLKYAGIYLPRPVFSHGELYVAVFSRVKSRKGLKILIHDKEGVASDETNNEVFKVIFQHVQQLM